MELETPYAFGKTVAMSYAQTEQKVRVELANEGFGILTEIDVKSKFAEKLQKDFRDYLILGACNPAMAYLALSQEVNIGTLLPCNVIVYSVDESRTVVSIMDPVVALAMIGNPRIDELAHQIAEKLRRVLAAL